MKTVKFSLNELMSEIDESFIEEVYFHDCNKILKKYSKQKIRQNVFCKTASKHKPLKFTYRTAIIVTVVSVFLCMPVYAAISHLLTSALIDDSNRHLIGTETNDRSYIILKDGVYTLSLIHILFFSVSCTWKRHRRIRSWGLPTRYLLCSDHSVAPIILGHKWNTICTTDCRCNFCYCYCVYGSTSS